jgi:hypothetical protein
LSLEPAFLTVVRGDESEGVGGFSWGAVVDVGDILGRVLSAHPMPVAELGHLERALSDLGTERVVFTDEIGIRPRFRSGVLPVAQLCYPTTVVGEYHKVPGLCWSKRSSRIVPILEHYQYRPIAHTEEIVFLYASAEGVAATKRALEEIFISAGCREEETHRIAHQTPARGGGD